MKRALMVAALAALVLGSSPRMASAQEIPSTGFDLEESWNQLRRSVRDAWPNFVAESKLRIERMRIVRRPRTVLAGFEAEPGLWQNLSAFYDFLENRELDVFEEQEGLPGYFPDRSAYYDFLDTIIPAMRERKFERNRLLEWQAHEITLLPEEEGQPRKAVVLMSITSDDTYPVGKLMVFRQTWIQAPAAWYPGKVEAETATWWERLR